MASWVFCNRCFQPPQGTACFSLTNCGHVYCDVCLRKGKRDECLICKVPCRTVLLSKRTDSDIQALFMGIDGLCRKYARETSQVLEFQEKHRRRLLAFYGEKISQLEESLRKSALRMGQPQSVRLSQQTAFSTMKSPVSTPSTKPNGPLFLPSGSLASARVESMEVDLTPSPRRKREAATGLTRISLLSPPRDGRMEARPWLGCVLLAVEPCPVIGFQEHRPRGRLLGAARASCGARGHCPQDRDLPWPMVLRQDLKDPLLKAWHPLSLWPECCPHDP
ncbi:probable E3 SUMO-protein ligase RNF212 [Delphinapterus leucas]|uniref:Probable E3 SUMO-protein ligase RNF212 n=1 Tax=Delphinapterus leucas TaxID=9749 RepID=A0A7F8K7C0_DELLE|nr:probable E3 SUMO-protein ligase RNF212 [Delphinapterus leucas]